MRKRPASSMASRPRSLIPTESLCLAVAAELSRSKDLSKATIDMLTASLPYLEHEHPYQEEVFDMVRTALQQREEALSSQVSESTAFLGEVSGAQTAVAGWRAEVKKATAALDADDKAVSEALAEVAVIKAEHDRQRRELETAPERKQALLAAIRDLYEPLKDGSIHRDSQEGYAESKLAKLLETVKSLRLNIGLTRCVSQALRHEPSRRSAADVSAIRQLGDELGHQAAMLELMEMRAASESASTVVPDEKLVSKQAALAQAQERQQASAEAAREAEEELQRCISTGRAGKKARVAADTAAAELKVFQEGALRAFRELAERRGFRSDRGGADQSAAESSTASMPLPVPASWGGSVALSDAVSSPPKISRCGDTPASSPASSKRLRASSMGSVSPRAPASPAGASPPLRAAADEAMRSPMTP